MTVDMKPTNANLKQELNIKRRLELVRTRIRELTPEQLQRANGGVVIDGPPTCAPLYTI